MLLILIFYRVYNYLLNCRLLIIMYNSLVCGTAANLFMKINTLSPLQQSIFANLFDVCFAMPNKPKGLIQVLKAAIL